MLLSMPWTTQPRASKYALAVDPIRPLEPVTSAVCDPTGSASDDVREAALRALEVNEPAREQERGDAYRDCEHRAGRIPRAENRPAETRDDPGHRVQPEQRAPLLGHDRGRVDDRGREEPDLDQEWDSLLHVAVRDVEGRQPKAHAQGGEDDKDDQRQHDQERFGLGIDAEVDHQTEEHAG